MSLKRFITSQIPVTNRITGLLQLGRWFSMTIPVIGTVISICLDKFIFFIYGVDGSSRRINVRHLRIPHPGGVLLGGNGINSNGRVLVNAGVKFVGVMPDNSYYLERHERGNVFELGDNVVIGANSVLIGPVSICDNVLIGAMSLVNKDITEEGVYVGCPAIKISNEVRDVWFS